MDCVPSPSMYASAANTPAAIAATKQETNAFAFIVSFSLPQIIAYIALLGKPPAGAVALVATDTKD